MTCDFSNLFNSNFFSSICGAALGAAGSYYGVKKTIESEIVKNDLSKLEDEVSYCHAILTELQLILQRYNLIAGEKLGNLKNGEFINFYYKASQNYFVIFDSNASQVGKIRNVELRQDIVKTYVSAKAILDSFELHNTSLKTLENFYVAERVNQDAQFQFRIHEIQVGLVESAAALKQEHINLTKCAQQTIENLKFYISSVELEVKTKKH